jgi:hypothetical protein
VTVQVWGVVDFMLETWTFVVPLSSWASFEDGLESGLLANEAMAKMSINAVVLSNFLFINNGLNGEKMAKQAPKAYLAR